MLNTISLETIVEFIKIALAVFTANFLTIALIKFMMSKSLILKASSIIVKSAPLLLF